MAFMSKSLDDRVWEAFLAVVTNLSRQDQPDDFLTHYRKALKLSNEWEKARSAHAAQAEKIEHPKTNIVGEVLQHHPQCRKMAEEQTRAMDGPLPVCFVTEEGFAQLVACPSVDAQFWEPQTIEIMKTCPVGGFTVPLWISRPVNEDQVFNRLHWYDEAKKRGKAEQALKEANERISQLEDELSDAKNAEQQAINERDMYRKEGETQRKNFAELRKENDDLRFRLRALGENKLVGP